MEIKTEILINANPEYVWEVLTDFENYPKWNPFIQHISGEAKVGNKLKVFLSPPNEKGMTFNPKVLVFDQNREFKWIGKLFVTGLFDGEHTFKLIDNKNGTTTFVQNEKFRGILVPLLKKRLQTNTLYGFNQMNESLKARVEECVKLNKVL